MSTKIISIVFDGLFEPEYPNCCGMNKPGQTVSLWSTLEQKPVAHSSVLRVIADKAAS